MSPSETTILLPLVISSTTTPTAVKTSLKMNLRPFKLIRVYLDLLYLTNEGHFSWSQTLEDLNIQVQKEKGKIRPRMFTSSIKP